MKPNRVKAAMKEGRVALGYSLIFPSPHVIEILAPFDFDFVWIDGEHGPFGLRELEEICRAAEAANVTPIARVPNIQSSTILQFLDRGIQGIMGPHIASKADAEQLVRACYFGPMGERSFGGNRGCDYGFQLDKPAYCKNANDNILVSALLEDKDVMQNLDEILSVPGIDYFLVGPNDFAQGMGYPGGAHLPEVKKAIDQVYARIHEAGRKTESDVLRLLNIRDCLVAAAQSFVLERQS
ncbi:MAG: 2-keto-3-deoxy-L-rhamnonate aldolase [Gemmatales bacterium]|nr:MAG: 2-keto-3-deoxy-L-rhamnonate aldolase [Gemmatales bacterium]